MKGTFVILIIYLVVNGCKSRNQRDLIFDAYQKMADSSYNPYNKDSLRFKVAESTTYKVYMKRYSSGNILSLKGYLLNEVYGHYFLFNFNGQLERYQYIVRNGKHFSYSIEKVKENYEEIGSPVVAFMIKTDCSSDNEICYSLLFSKFPRQVVDVKMSIDGILFTPLRLNNSNLMPFLAKSTLKLGKPVNVVYLKINCRDLVINFPGLTDKISIIDTLQLN